MPFQRLSKSLFAQIRSKPFAFIVIGIVALGALGASLKYLDEDAQRQAALKPKDRSFLASVNPFLSAPSPTPTPQLSKEYIYAGSRLLAVEDANATAVPPADLAVWRPSNGTWYVMGGPGSAQTEQGWGLNGDIPTPGDYDGDGKTDFAVFRPSEGKWYVMHSSNGSSSTTEFGLNGDTPAAADFDGDGRTDRAVFRQNDPSSGLSTWYILRSSDSTQYSQQFGITGDKPEPADYDGDGRADLCVWRNSNKTFYSINSSNGVLNTIVFSFPKSAEAISGDYDGDGRDDYAAKSSNTWRIRKSTTSSIESVIWGPGSGLAKAVPNDYDGDGKCDIAVWNLPACTPGCTSVWEIRQSSKLGQPDELRSVNWGIAGDIPVPAYYRR